MYSLWNWPVLRCPLHARTYSLAFMPPGTYTAYNIIAISKSSTRQAFASIWKICSKASPTSPASLHLSITHTRGPKECVKARSMVTAFVFVDGRCKKEKEAKRTLQIRSKVMETEIENATSQCFTTTSVKDHRAQRDLQQPR
jgi:hypothetical protein